ncbi:MAG: MBL fold metallo-hydrolase [Daejeonella sp.]
MVNKTGIVVVDSQFPGSANHLIAELKKKSQNPFKYLINTHHHGDHTSGNLVFKDVVKNMVAHSNSLINQKNVAALQKTEEKQLYPNITFTEEWKTKVGSDLIKAHYFGAAHTNGDSIIHFENTNIAHLGDLVFNRKFPYIDRTAGANIQSWIQVLDKVVNKFDSDTLFVFGHAADPEKIIGTKEDIKAMQNYLDKLLIFTGSEIKAGKTKEDILKNTVIPGAEDFTGEGIERSLTAAYEELTGQ